MDDRTSCSVATVSENTGRTNGVSETLWNRTGSLIFVGRVWSGKNTFWPTIACFLEFHVL